MALEPLLQRLDRIAGGRHASITIPETARTHPKTRRAFAWIMWLLMVELILGIGAAVFAVMLATAGDPVPFAVWMRTFIVLAMTVTLFYFAWRASRGWYWAYSRLRLFAQIFPVITLVMAAIPNLYPAWMITEQIVFSLIMIGIADFLTSDHMRDAYKKDAGEPGEVGAAPEKS